MLSVSTSTIFNNPNASEGCRPRGLMHLLGPVEEPITLSTRRILLDFIRKSGIDNPFHFIGIDPVVRQRFYDVVNTWDLAITEQQHNKYAALGLNMAASSYRHTPTEVQISIALYSFLGIMIDDAVMSKESIREFPARYFDGRPQLHPILTHFVDIIAGIRRHFLPFGANIISTNSLDFINAEMFVRDEGGPDLNGPLDTAYADYIRLKTGIGEAYSIYVWPRSMFSQTKVYAQAIPHAAEWVSFANDLFSFYKEVEAGETDNYISQVAAAQDKSQVEVLQNLADRVIDVDRRIKALLGDAPERRAWESFIAGYFEFHLHTPRYRLKDLLPEYF